MGGFHSYLTPFLRTLTLAASVPILIRPFPICLYWATAGYKMRDVFRRNGDSLDLALAPPCAS